MWNKIGRIVSLLASDLHVSPEQALDIFYRSHTNELMRDPATMLYTFSDRYITNEIIKEQQ